MIGTYWLPKHRGICMMRYMKLHISQAFPSTLSKAVDVGLVMAVIFGLTLKPSYAYLDPNTGSYMIQMAIAGAFAGLFAIKSFWTQIKTFINAKLRSRQKKS
jgi:hypothetical protein